LVIQTSRQQRGFEEGLEFVEELGAGGAVDDAVIAESVRVMTWRGTISRLPAISLTTGCQRCADGEDGGLGGLMMAAKSLTPNMPRLEW